VPAGALAGHDLERIQEQFHEAHARAYGDAAREAPVELATVRLTAIGVSPNPRHKALPTGTGDFQVVVKGHRAVWFSETFGFTSCPFVDC
jgi:N-methylhydantoinase A